MATVSVANTDSGLSGKTIDLLESDQTITGLKTFSRGAQSPFAVAVGSTKVSNLDADLLDGQDWAAPTITGAPTFSGSINLTGGQISFPAVQVPSAGANVLDDYEENTWTPTIGGAGGQSGQVYTTQNGFYVKVGQLVLASCTIILSTLGTITGAALIKGLPFTVATTTNALFVNSVRWSGLSTTWVNIITLLDSGSTQAELLGATAAGAANTTALLQADLGNATQLTCNFVYRASA